jgi:hypothetical protein
MLLVPILFLVLGIAYGGSQKFRFKFRNTDPSGNADIVSMTVCSKGAARASIVHCRMGQNDYIDTKITSLDDIQEIRLKTRGGEIIPVKIPVLNGPPPAIPDTNRVFATLEYHAVVINSCGDH